MSETRFIIRPSVDAKPKDKPQEVEVRLQYDDVTHDPTFTVGGHSIISLRPGGYISCWFLSTDVAKQTGLVLSDDGCVGLVKGCSRTAFADAIQAEREACAKVATDTKPQGTNIYICQDIAARIRARGEPKEVEE